MDEKKKIPPVNMGKVKVPCRRHKKLGIVIEACPACNVDITVLRHTDHARKRHIDVPVIRRPVKINNKYNGKGELCQKQEK